MTIIDSTIPQAYTGNYIPPLNSEMHYSRYTTENPLHITTSYGGNTIYINELSDAEKAWMTVLENYTKALLEASALKGLKPIENTRLQSAQIKTRLSETSWITQTLSLAYTITNIANKIFKGAALFFGIAALINAVTLPITLPKVVVCTVISLSCAAISLIFKLSMICIDKLKERWMNSYTSQSDREELENFKNWQKIENLDQIEASMQAVRTAYTHATQLQVRGRGDWNQQTMAQFKEFEHMIKEYRKL